MNLAIILAGGSGIRLGAALPKQYIRVDGRMILCYGLEACLRAPEIDGVRIVCGDAYRAEIASVYVADGVCETDGLQAFPVTGDIQADGLQALPVMGDIQADGLQALPVMGDIQVDGMQTLRDRESAELCELWQRKFLGFSQPGENRQCSIWNALRDIRANEGAEKPAGMCVMICDAARPNLTEDLIGRLFAALPGHDGVMPVLPMKDTIYQSANGRTIAAILPREQLFAGQAPEVFDFSRYYDACEALLPERILQISGSSEPAVLAGLEIAVIPGDENNYKITTAADLKRFREEHSVREKPERESGWN